jgi:hypothetical protein
MTDITYKDVHDWIVSHSTDEEAMNELNRLTYVFTTKYKERAGKPE